MRFSLPRKQNKFIENRNKTQKIPKNSGSFRNSRTIIQNKICTTMNATNQIRAYGEF